MVKKLILIFIMLFAFTSIVSCKKNDDNSENNNGGEENNVTVTAVSVLSSPEFIYSNDLDSLSEIKLNVTYSDSTTKTVNVNKDMMSSEDYAKLSTAGEHKVTITVEKFNYELTIIIKEDLSDKYTVTVVYPNGEPVTSKVSVQWCSATNCFLPVKVNEEGMAVTNLDDGTYYIHLNNVPAGFTYNPNKYTTTPSNKHITIELVQLGEMYPGEWGNLYVIKDGTYNISINGNSTNDGIYFEFVAQESGTYNIYSMAMEKLAENEIDPYIGVFKDDTFNLGSADVSGNKDSSININFNHELVAEAGESYYFIIIVTSATEYPANFDFVVEKVK